MPSKLSVHLGSYPPNVFDILARMRPSVVKVFNQSSEINIGMIMGTTPHTPIIYRQYTDLDYHNSTADQYFAEIGDTFNKLAGRGLYWEGINEPIINNAAEAKLLSKWFTRFAQILHERGEKVAGFSWSTGNPHPELYPQIIPPLADCAAQMDLHAFHEYYTTGYGTSDWGLYRRFEEALPAYARKPVVITEAGYDDTGQASNGGWRGKVTPQQYMEILKDYDKLLLEDPYVLGATVYQWGDGAWPSFELESMINLFADYVQSVGGGVVLPRPFPVPTFRETFAATPASIFVGDSTKLEWQVTGALSVFLDGQAVAPQDSMIIAPTETTTYTLRIVYPDNVIKELTATVTVTASNTVHITKVEFNPLVLQVGDLLNVSITVRNDTAIMIQTQGPNPGFVYNEGETFVTRGFPAIPNAYRVALDFEGRTGIDHPYRWGLGAPLPPGQSTTITGAIRIKNLQNAKYWAGLARELVSWEQDHKGEQAIAVTAGGQVQITNVTFTPTTLRAGDAVNVSMTVRNGTAETLPTQDPAPGFVYEEGDSFDSRGFASVRDAFRVGIDFDGRNGVDHPYRWGLGSPLAPGQTTTVTGSILLKTPRATNYWAGLARELTAWVQDRQGVQSINVTPAPTGSVEITDVKFTPTVLRAGDTLTFSITVRNGTPAPLATQGPEPGLIYEEGEDFRGRGYTEVRGAYRIGIDFDGRDGIDHPYRWGLGAPLAPGQSATITGGIRLKTPRTVNYWAGLVSEQVAWVQDRRGTQSVKVNPAGAPTIASVTFTPVSLASGNLLNVSILVRNDSAETLPTQDPAPGFVYEEGDSFRSRGFTEMRDAYRVGVDFDGRAGIDHPYRWGLGAPLAPGQTATITGMIRLRTQRTLNYWAGFVREQVAWLQDRQGVQAISVTAPVPPPAPTLTLSPTTIAAGQSATITWNAPSAQSVSLNNIPVSAQGTQTVSPTQTTTYTLNVVYPDATARTLSATLTVNPPATASLNAAPTSITAGQSATLTWTTTSAVSATLNGASVATSGSQVVTPAQTTTYTLHVVFNDGTVRDQAVTIIVNVVPTVSFAATPTTIPPGGSATLTWQTTGATTTTLSSMPVAAVVAPTQIANEPVPASGTRVVSPAESTHYTLRVAFTDGSTRDSQVTINVSSAAPTRPPTVTITPENAARLKTFPRPANDNGRGLHFNIDLRDTTIANTVQNLQSIGCKWTLIYAPDENQAKRAAQGCWSAGIMPIVRIGKKVDEPFDPVVYVNALKAIGAPPYVQIYNEPGDIREWKNWPGDDKWLGMFAARWAHAAIAVFDAGGYPGLQVLGKEELLAALNSVKAQNRTDILARTFFALHNYGANHPPAYPYDPRNQQDNPGATIMTDDTAVLNFLEFAAWMKDAIGFVLPFIGGEGGWQYGAQEDPRYPRIEKQLHAQNHKEMFEWFRTGVLSNGEPLPDYLFSVTPWIEGGWGGDDWWGGPEGDKTDTINAVKSIAPFTRQFSWDGDGGVLIPPVALAFSALPDTIDVGGTSTLTWQIMGASSITLDGTAVAASGSQVVAPTRTTTYTLRVVLTDNTTRDLTATVTVRQPAPPAQLVWDARLDPLGVKLTRATPSPAWRVTSALFQDETQSSLNHNIYFTVKAANGAPAVGAIVVVDWVGRSGGDQPAEATTDANGQADIPIWSILHLAHPDGPYFAYIKGAASDVVSGMGLPENRHVNFLLTFQFQ